MEALKTLLRNIAKLDVSVIINSILVEEEVQKFIIDLNTDDQLFGKGVGADGNKLAPAYSNPYKRKKDKLGLPTDRVTLFLTGELHENFGIELFDTYFILKTERDAKGFDLAEHLRKVYGEYEGLTDDSTDKLSEFITPLLQTKIQDAILRFNS